MRPRSQVMIGPSVLRRAYAEARHALGSAHLPHIPASGNGQPLWFSSPNLVSSAQYEIEARRMLPSPQIGGAMASDPCASVEELIAPVTLANLEQRPVSKVIREDFESVDG